MKVKEAVKYIKFPVNRSGLWDVDTMKWKLNTEIIKNWDDIYYPNLFFLYSISSIEL